MNKNKSQCDTPKTSKLPEPHVVVDTPQSKRMQNMIKILQAEEARANMAVTQPTIDGDEKNEDQANEYCENNIREMLEAQEILLIDFTNFKDNPEAQKIINDNFDGEKIIFKKDTLLEALRKGLVKSENAPGNGLLIFMYGKGTLNSICRKIFHLKILTVLCGNYNNRIASEKRILSFIKSILHIDISTSNIDQINKIFKRKYGKGIDEFKSINEIFSRLYTREYLQQIINNAKPEKGDIITSATSRVRFYENVNIDIDFNLANKNIGGHTNSFNVRRLLGGFNKDDDKSFINGHFKQTMEDYITKLKNIEEELKHTTNSQNKIRLIKKLTIFQKKITPLCNSVLLHGLAHCVEGATMVVNRLSPFDYHNFHFPFSSGKILTKLQMAEKLAEMIQLLPLESAVKEAYFYVTKIIQDYSINDQDQSNPTVRIDGKYMSVNTHAITSKAIDYNPLVENVREVLFIESDEYGIIPYVIIGANMVAGISLKIKSGQSLKMGDEMGHFKFGGSSVIMFVPAGKAIPYEHTRKLQNIYYEIAESGLEKNLREMEIYMPIGTPIFHPQRNHPLDQSSLRD